MKENTEDKQEINTNSDILLPNKKVLWLFSTELQECALDNSGQTLSISRESAGKALYDRM